MERAECCVRCVLIIISSVLAVFKSRLFWRHQFIKCWTSSLYAVSLFEICPTMASKFDNGVCVMYGRIVVWIWSRRGPENAPLGCACVEYEGGWCVPPHPDGLWSVAEEVKNRQEGIQIVYEIFLETGASLLIRLEAHWLPGNSSLRPLLHVQLAKSLNRFGTAKANYLNCPTLSVSVFYKLCPLLNCSTEPECLLIV